MKIVKNIVCVLFGLMFMNAGLDKLFHYLPMPKMDGEMQKIMEALGSLKWLLPLIGCIEAIGGLLFMIPKTRALGAIMILPVMVGIVLHNAVFMPSGLGLAGVLFAINVWMIVDNFAKYKPMIS